MWKKPKHSHVLTGPEILKVWHVFIGINRTHTEVIELEEFRFYLQSRMSIFPRQLLSSSKIFQHIF